MAARRLERAFASRGPWTIWGTATAWSKLDQHVLFGVLQEAVLVRRQGVADGHSGPEARRGRRLRRRSLT
jgi:hypothetical protein